MSVRSKLFAFISHLHSVTLTLSVEIETADKKHQGRKFKKIYKTNRFKGSRLTGLAVSGYVVCF